MKKLLQGIVDFRNNLTDERRALFAQLALGQKPDAFFVGCSDSRVVPNLFASTNPGDLFVSRTIGNLVPPASLAANDHCVPAAIEFSVLALNVSNIIVCGHSECGAMEAIASGSPPCECHNLSHWLKYGEESLAKVRGGFVLDATLSEVNQVSQVNVLQQMEHIKSYPFVEERIAAGRLQVHGWWFDIAHADVYCYEQSLNRFVVIDDREAKMILQRLG